MYPSLINKRHYALIGILVSRHRPEVASELIATFMPHSTPIDSDISRIAYYFDAFCESKGLSAADLRGKLYNRSRVDLRRQFVCALLHIYMPQLFHQPLENLMMGATGFVTEIAKIFGVTVSWITYMVREAIAWHKQYEDFAESVENILKQITEGHEVE